MRVSRPYWDREAFEKGERATGRCTHSGTCAVCGATAVREYCESDAYGDRLDIWVALCFEHRDRPLRSWRDATDTFLQSVIDLKGERSEAVV